MSQPPYYQPGGWSVARPVPARPHSTSRTEIVQILVAFAVLTFDLVLILVGFGAIYGGTLSSLTASISWQVALLAGACALTGFLAHELAHKFVAQRLGYWAEFRVYPIGLLLSLFIAYATGFLLAAPGATMVGGMSYEDRRGWGRTAIAGPSTNAVFAVVFYLAAVATISIGGLLTFGLLFLTYINAWFATFNMIPFGALDGAKVWRWGKAQWAGMFVVGAGLTALGYLGLVYGSPLLGFR
jgi:Zn-dependent protease